MRFRRTFQTISTLAGVVAILYAANFQAQAQTNTPPTPGAGAGMPGMMGMPGFEQEELTLETAKAALDCFLELKVKYGDDKMPDISPSPAVGAPQALQQFAGFQNTVKSYGFTDVGHWHRSMMSLFLAYDFQTEGRREEYEHSITQMNQSNMPENVKEQMMAMLKNLRPSEHNVAVATELAEDPEYAVKFEKIQE